MLWKNHNMKNQTSVYIDRVWKEGICLPEQTPIQTNSGIVLVWRMDNWIGEGPATLFCTVRDGWYYRKYYHNKTYSDRYCVTLAKRFIKDVIEGTLQP